VGIRQSQEARKHGWSATIVFSPPPTVPFPPHFSHTPLFLDLQHDVSTKHSLGTQKHTKSGNIYIIPTSKIARNEFHWGTFYLLHFKRETI
jgi:hypothetical protein